MIEDGDIVAFDTDLIGPYGYCCDISRTWLAGAGGPTNEQRALYAHGRGADRREHGDAPARPNFSRAVACGDEACRSDYLPNRYSVLFHGVGLCDEYPAVPYPEDWERSGYDGVLEPGHDRLRRELCRPARRA